MVWNEMKYFFLNQTELECDSDAQSSGTKIASDLTSLKLEAKPVIHWPNSYIQGLPKVNADIFFTALLHYTNFSCFLILYSWYQLQGQ